MCRLVAYHGTALSPERAVFGGDHSLYEQSWAPRELLSGSVNVDGYGVVWYPEAGGADEPAAPARIARTEPIWHDPDLRQVLGAVRSTVVLAALRNATPGLPVDRAGLLPLVHGRRSFVLNGWVPDFRERHMRALRSALPDDLYAALQGVSDAETLFLLVVAQLEAGLEPVQALRAVVAQVEGRLDDGEWAPLTMALAAPDGVWVLNAAAGQGRCNSLYWSVGASLASGGVLIASEALDGDPSWRPVPLGAAIASSAGQTVLVP